MKSHSIALLFLFTVSFDDPAFARTVSKVGENEAVSTANETEPLVLQSKYAKWWKFRHVEWLQINRGLGDFGPSNAEFAFNRNDAGRLAYTYWMCQAHGCAQPVTQEGHLLIRGQPTWAQAVSLCAFPTVDAG